MYRRFFCTLEESVFPVLWEFCSQIPLAFKVKFPRGSQSLCRSPGWEIFSYLVVFYYFETTKSLFYDKKYEFAYGSLTDGETKIIDGDT